MKRYVYLVILILVILIGIFIYYDESANIIDIKYPSFNIPNLFDKQVIISSNSFNSTNTNVTNNDFFAHLNISENDPYTNLMLYLSFDENVSSTTVYDYSKYNLTGRVRNGAEYKADSPYGNYYDFDGLDDYIEVGKNSTLQITGNLTISTWIRVDSLVANGAFQRIITMTGAIPVPETETQNTLYQLYLQNTGGILYLSNFHEYGAGTNALNVSTNATVSVGQWTHVTMVRNTAKKTLEMYKNGNLIQTIGYISNPTGGTNGTLTINGAYLDTTAPGNFTGGIDEVMIFNQTLTPAQILDIYNNQSQRFHPTGIQTFLNQNLSSNGQENMLNITLTNYQHLLDSNISALVEGQIYQFDANNKISDITITGDINWLNISLLYSAGNLTNAFYSPLVGNITLTTWNETAPSDLIYPDFSDYWDYNASIVNSGTGNFNVTVNNTNGTVFLEINGVNISATNITSNVYNASYTFSSGGVYNYSWNALGNGTNKNLNVSTVRMYTVNNTIFTYELNYSTNYSVFFVKQNSSKSFNFTCTANGALTNYNVSIDGNLFYTGQNNPYIVNGSNYSIGLHNMTLVCGDKSKYYQFENLGNKSFIILSLSDTQNYVRQDWYDTTSQKILDDIFNWMNNVSYDATIEFMVQNGDVVDSNDDYASEWNTMNQSFSRLNSLLEWFAVPGNHDYDNTNTTDGFYGINVDRNLTMWNKYFPANVYEDRPYWGGNLTGGTQNSYQFFNFSGLNYMVLNIEFCPNKTTMDEINSTLHANENKNVIINTHVWLWNNTIARQRFGYYNWDTCYYMNDDAYYPLRMWNEYFRYNDNIDLILSGHIVDGKDEDNKNVGAGLHINYTESGHQVLSTYFNYQNYATQGDSGAGYLNYYIIDHQNKSLTMRTYSPYLNDLDNTGYVNLVYSNQNDIFYKNFTLNYNVLSVYEQCIFDGGTIQTCDTLYPQFSSYWDTNATLIDSGVGYFNVTLTNTNSTVLLEINGVNISATNLSGNIFNASYTFSSSGVYNYKWHSWGNGTAKQLNSSIVRTYTVNASSDIIAPNVINSNLYPSNGSAYSFYQIYNFNVTASDSSSVYTAIFEFNGTNRTASSVGNVYYVNLGNLSVGVYNYRWYVNDTLGNANNSVSGTYTVVKATPTATISITSPITYGDSAGVSYSESNFGDGGMTYTFYRNNVSLASPDSSILKAGSYTYHVNITGNENYSSVAVSDIEVLTINKATPTVMTLLDGVRNDNTVLYDTIISFEGILSNGYFVDLNLTIDGVQTNYSTTTNLTYYQNFSIGSYIITTNYSGNENWSARSETWTLTVTDTLSTTVTSRNDGGLVFMVKCWESVNDTCQEKYYSQTCPASTYTSFDNCVNKVQSSEKNQNIKLFIIILLAGCVAIVFVLILNLSVPKIKK